MILHGTKHNIESAMGSARHLSAPQSLPPIPPRQRHQLKQHLEGPPKIESNFSKAAESSRMAPDAKPNFTMNFANHPGAAVAISLLFCHLLQESHSHVTCCYGYCRSSSNLQGHACCEWLHAWTNNNLLENFRLVAHLGISIAHMRARNEEKCGRDVVWKGIIH
jgi:hypothetical protein